MVLRTDYLKQNLQSETLEKVFLNPMNIVLILQTNVNI